MTFKLLSAHILARSVIFHSGLNRVDLYCTLWVGAWTSTERPSEAFVASDFAHGKACDGMMTHVASTGELNPIWRTAANRQVRSREGSGEGGVPNTTVVAWLMNKKLVCLFHSSILTYY